MGYGLWILNEIVTATKGRLHLYSEGAYVFNDFGKIKKALVLLAGNNHLYIFAISKSAIIIRYKRR